MIKRLGGGGLGRVSLDLRDLDSQVSGFSCLGLNRNRVSTGNWNSLKLSLQGVCKVNLY